jgi:hypothetical protein
VVVNLQLMHNQEHHDFKYCCTEAESQTATPSLFCAQ